MLVFGYFVTLTAPKTSSAWVCPSSHKLVIYLMAAKNEQSKPLKMEKIKVPLFSVCIGHSFLQHAGNGWKGYLALRIHSYMIRDDVEVKDVEAISYGAFLKRKVDDEMELGGARFRHQQIEEERGFPTFKGM